jgi:hypothetical protein
MVEPLLIHIHVPKCAGTTVEGHLHSELGDQGFWSPPKRTRKYPLGWFGRKYDATPPTAVENIKAVSGHFVGRSFEDMFPGRRIIRSMILREPEALLLSYYNYRMMRYVMRGRNAYGFSLFLRATRENFITHFLLERWLELPWVKLIPMPGEQKAMLLDEIMASVDYVVPIGETDQLVEKLSEELGISPLARRQNTAEANQKMSGWKILRSADISKADRLELKARTNLDRYLWRRWVLKDGAQFRAEPARRFVQTEFVRPRYQAERRLARMFG